MTQAETILWRALRGSALDGDKFRRQAPIGRYVADFLCVAHRLIVELDGPPHDGGEQQQHDALRDRWLREHGYRILRFPNAIVPAAEIACSIESVGQSGKTGRSNEPSSGPR